MKLNKNAQIAFAVGWFVLLDILLRTTEGAANTVNVATSIFRGVLRGLVFNYFVLGLGIVALLSIALLSLLIINYLIRAWANVIKLTRTLVKYYFFDSTSDSVDNSLEEKKMLEKIFGEDALKSRDAFLWLSLRSLLVIWIIVIVIDILAGVVNVISVY